ncbi:GIY-YIG nuclease superfamily [uncultured Caudovirales phage]|uniref:GIY-YIG nuclease superfamily n=1 Tax=uncultured Caudovirales phage TaxID=2100421 RepID=A0A6J5RKK3_9CAUD|nr:GIY-YIG nuclease superfamily [uncultured Caudovirales phage]
MYYVYSITNKISNKVYIGKTKNPKERWQKHLSSVRTHKMI